MQIHSSFACALVGLLGLGAAPFLPESPAAITFLAASVVLIVAVGLGVAGFLLARPRVTSAGAGLVLGVLGLVGAGLLAADGFEAPSPAVEAAGPER